MASERQRCEALLFIRIIWAALVMSQFVFFITGCFLVFREETIFTVSDEYVMTLFYLTLAMLLVGVPAGYFIRSQTYKRCWRQDAVTPAGYVGGNLVLLVICKGVTTLGLITMLHGRQLWPYLLPMVPALAVLVFNFPHGLPMEPTGNAQEL